MIEAHPTPVNGRLQLRVVYPDRKQPELVTVANRAEAFRLVYFKNREYMISKLRSWLKQRMYSGDQVKSMECSKLLVLLGYYEHLSFPKICRVVHNHRSAIEAIAPGERSRCYNYYTRVIVPILNDAAEMEGAI